MVDPLLTSYHILLLGSFVSRKCFQVVNCHCVESTSCAIEPTNDKTLEDMSTHQESSSLSVLLPWFLSLNRCLPDMLRPHRFSSFGLPIVLTSSVCLQHDVAETRMQSEREETIRSLQEAAQRRDRFFTAISHEVCTHRMRHSCSSSFQQNSCPGRHRKMLRSETRPSLQYCNRRSLPARVYFPLPVSFTCRGV